MSDPSDRSRVLYRRAPRGLPRPDLERFARQLETEVAGTRGFQCLITDDAELRRLNLQFRGKDYPADVLSFPEPDEGYLGEMAISAERAACQAAEFGHSTADEIRILMLHGVLHLLGMDHERDRGRMRRAESAWRGKLGLKAGLIERVRP
ncbi:MAG: rRNA maturation RNase YbeY [Bryobacteraceae bacterium]